MTDSNFSYATRIGNTTFIVSIKQSESAEKPLDSVFKEICKHELLGAFSTNNFLNLEKLQKSS